MVLSKKKHSDVRKEKHSFLFLPIHQETPTQLFWLMKPSHYEMTELFRGTLHILSDRICELFLVFTE